MNSGNKKEVFHLKGFEQSYGYAQAVKVGKTLYISGTVSIDEAGNPKAAGDMEAQIYNIYEDIRKTLEAHGATFDHVVKEAIFTLDLDKFKAQAVPIRAEFYRGHSLPASSAWIQVSRLAFPEFLVEIEAIAALL